MLTCEEIAERVAAMNIPVNRSTYHDIAQRIHPRVLMPEQDDDTPPPSGPEWREYQRRHNTDDWTDMVIKCVTLWQWRAALRTARVGAILERFNP